MRLRAASSANPKMPQRAAVITGTVAGDAISAYVVFKERPGALAAVKASGTEAFGRHLRVAPASKPGESSSAPQLHDTKRSVFLGNLPFDIAEETLWTLFGDCGAIDYVRLVREPRTQQGKGFGYVAFKDAGSVERALALHGTQVACAPPEPGVKGPKKAQTRAIRVYRCSNAKSNARALEKQQESKPKGAKRPRTPEDQAEGGGEAKGADRNSRKGWMDRERRRFDKKQRGKLAKRGGAADNALAAAQRADKVAAALQRAKKDGKLDVTKSKGAGTKPGKVIKKTRGRTAKEMAKAKKPVRKGVRGK